MAGVASLAVRNNTRTPVTIAVLVGGALDDGRKEFGLPELTVGAGSQVVTQVDLSNFETDLADLDFSGRLVAKGFARPAGGGQVLDLVYSPHLFFHVDQGKIIAYRQRALVERFNAGDYAGRAGSMRKWAARRGLQIAGVGRLGSGLELTDDDGGPKEGAPEP